MKILFAGDTMLSKKVFLPADITDLINGYDLFSYNCETVVSEKNYCNEHKRYALIARKENMNIWGDIKIPMLASVANNHCTDYGVDGLNDTVQALDEKGDCIGTKEKKYIIYTEKNKKICIYSIYWAYNADVNSLALKREKGFELVCDELKALKSKVDVLIVQVHYGEEYVLLPEKKYIDFFRKFIDVGVDCIVGHHPHVILPCEYYRAGVICYSLGNFQFGIKENYANSNIGMMVSYDTIEKKIEIIPLLLDDDYIPHLMLDKNDYIHNYLDKKCALIKHIGIKYQLKWLQYASGLFMKNNFDSWIWRFNKYGIEQLPLFLRSVISFNYIRMFVGFVLGGYKCKTEYIFPNKTGDCR